MTQAVYVYGVREGQRMSEGLQNARVLKGELPGLTSCSTNLTYVLYQTLTQFPHVKFSIFSTLKREREAVMLDESESIHDFQGH